MKNSFRVFLTVAALLTTFSAKAAYNFQESPPQQNPPQEGPVQEDPTEQFDLICFVAASEVKAFVGFKIERSSAENDVMVVYLQDNGEVKGYVTGLEKGGFEKATEAGELNALLMGQAFAQENGVLKDAAMLQMKLNELSDVFEGLLLAKGNAYPLVCPRSTLKKPAVPTPAEPAKPLPADPSDPANQGSGEASGE